MSRDKERFTCRSALDLRRTCEQRPPSRVHGSSWEVNSETSKVFVNVHHRQELYLRSVHAATFDGPYHLFNILSHEQDILGLVRGG